MVGRKGREARAQALAYGRRSRAAASEDGQQVDEMSPWSRGVAADMLRRLVGHSSSSCQVLWLSTVDAIRLLARLREVRLRELERSRRVDQLPALRQHARLASWGHSASVPERGVARYLLVGCQLTNWSSDARGRYLRRLYPIPRTDAVPGLGLVQGTTRDDRPGPQ